jgi:hypothetical protein
VVGVIKTLNDGNPRIVQPVFGSGESGAKSRELRALRPLVERTPILYPESSALTPLFILGFVERAGIKPGDDKKTITEKIMLTPFSREELIVIKEIQATFEGYAIGIRSDEECALGIGVWQSRFMLNPDTKTETFEKFAEHVKKIVIHNLTSQDVKAFRLRKNYPLDAPIGIFTMPFHGANLGEFDPDSKDSIFPLLHFNVLTRFSSNEADLGGTELVFGSGIGGANRSYNQGDCLWRLSGSSLRYDYIYNDVIGLSLRWGEIGTVNLTHRIPKLLEAARDANFFEHVAQEIRHEMYTLDQLLGSAAYLEFTHCVVYPHLALVQGSPIKYAPVEKPEVDKSSILINADQKDVYGRGVREVKKILFIKPGSGFWYALARGEEEDELPELQQLIEFNRSNSDYLLVVDGLPVTRSFIHFPLRAFSNAAGFVVVDTMESAVLYSHYGGVWRELGILGILASGNNIDHLRSELGIHTAEGAHDVNLIMYANEREGTGFISRV